MTFIKDNQQTTIENRSTISEIVRSLQKENAEQTMLEQEIYTLQRLNDIFIHFVKTVSGLTEIVSVTRNTFATTLFAFEYAFVGSSLSNYSKTRL